MQFSTLFTAALMGAVASAQSVFVVSVGSTGDEPLTFSPNNITAAVGDMIQFQFRAGNHTLTQSNFDNPCMPISMFTNTTGIYSGFMPVEAGDAIGEVPTYTIPIESTAPMWFYCSQASHCQGGMVMAVNENVAANSTRSLDNFRELAALATVNLAGDATSIEEDLTGTTTVDEDEDTTTDTTEDDAEVVDTAGAAGVAAPMVLAGFAAFAALLL